MKYILFAFIILCTCFYSNAQNLTDSLAIDELCITAEEQELYDLLMEYRKKRKLPPIPLSRSLTYVAKIHAMDLHYNRPFRTKKCNMHSWSKSDAWTSCCYTSDHRRAKYMWNKPDELTEYTSEGYEIAYGYGNRNDYLEHGLITAENALGGWKSSQGHNYMMINRGEWKKLEWNAIGIAIYKDFALVWFGVEIDEAEVIGICDN
ncbi:MAG: CAP domain-containing protein [Bacteroidia bacterium]|nr:CAP domain-containing protein [Bacteroidia bacterium]NNC85799.1 CAP domain-containing protein [Bacteroidia bacterium]NNM15864.1 CAP domain-containing protein [Bacteroidia bacterium]